MLFEVSADEAGARVDRVVHVRLGWTRAAVAELFRDRRVRVNGHRVVKGRRVALGDRISFDGELAAGMDAVPDPDVAITIRYEDAQLLLVDKPAGVAVHPLGPGETGCLANGLVAQFPELRGVGREPRQPGLVNRIDNDTSGLVIVARTQPVFEALWHQLSTGQIQKRYLAVCDRAPRLGELSSRMAPDPRDTRRMRLEGSPGAGAPREELAWMPAQTRVLDVRAYHGSALVEVEAHRARRHQVRCHLAGAGSPIVGDTLYGGRPLPSGHLLHASDVSLANPETYRRVHVESPLPGWWPGVLEAATSGGTPLEGDS